LAQDQFNNIMDRGYNVRACVVNKETLAKYDWLQDRVVAGSYDLVYITPEQLLDNEVFRGMLQNKTYQKFLRFVACDECLYYHGSRSALSLLASPMSGRWFPKV
jgi:superfamily II DNA helicase RecQ